MTCDESKHHNITNLFIKENFLKKEGCFLTRKKRSLSFPCPCMNSEHFQAQQRQSK